MNWHKVNDGLFIAGNPAAEFTVRRNGDEWKASIALDGYPGEWTLYCGPSLEEAMNAAKLEEQEHAQN